MRITLLRALYIVLMVSLLDPAALFAQYQSDKLPLVPWPVEVQLHTGTFIMDLTTEIVLNDDSTASDVRFLTDYLESHYGLHLKISRSGKARKHALNFIREKSGGFQHADEYSLEITKDKVELSAGPGAGIFLGIQSLIQLLPPGKVSQLTLPCLHISDYPRFAWRGMHLDVSRHFFSKTDIKKFLDLLAMYKFNTFHWHLTDDQGWRIEIRKYPRLQEIAAWREKTLIGHYGDQPEQYDTMRYGGYYTQDDVREIVNYASQRHITIVPEIELPGHATAALAAYPGLACAGDSFKVAGTWGVFKDVFCPTEETFTFLDNVLKEVAGLFPGTYIHVGGDECPKDRWKESEFCQSLMKKMGWQDEHRLQSYFMERVEKILHTYNKRMIGWDEILEGGLAPDATVMSWRGDAGGIEAAKMDHDVVMTPTGFCYFDYYQSLSADEPLSIGGYLPLQKVYSFEPVPEQLTGALAAHILGAQGNIWTEYIPDFSHVEYMALPRICAMAEVTWSPKSVRNYKAFTTHLSGHFKMLDFLGVNYSKALYDIDYFSYPAEHNRGLSVELSTEYPGGVIRYTTDGSEPGPASPVYRERINFEQSTGIKAALFDGAIRRERIFKKLFRINLATGKEVTLVHAPNEEYCRGGGFTLVNGVTGGLPWQGRDWLGFLGDDLDVTVDLGGERAFTKVGIDVLKDEQSRIWLPGKITVYSSADGKTYQQLAELDSTKINASGRMLQLPVGKQFTRWVRIVATNHGLISGDNPGAGSPAWLFVDEISVE